MSVTIVFTILPCMHTREKKKPRSTVIKKIILERKTKKK